MKAKAKAQEEKGEPYKPHMYVQLTSRNHCVFISIINVQRKQASETAAAVPAAAAAE